MGILIIYFDIERIYLQNNCVQLITIKHLILMIFINNFWEEIDPATNIILNNLEA